MGILLQPTWWKDSNGTSPPQQWEAVSHAVSVAITANQPAIFTSDLAFPSTTPMVLSATPIGGDPLFANVSLLLHNDSYGFTDSSGYAHSMVNYSGNSVTYSSAIAKFGAGSAGFNSGVSTLYCLDAPEFDFGTGDWTIEAFVFPASGHFGFATRPIVSKRLPGGSNNPPYDIFVDATNHLRANGLTSGGATVYSLTSSNTLVSDTWSHIEIDRHGNVFTMRINGVTVASVTNAGTLNTNTEHVKIGGVESEGNNFGGNIDELRMTKGVARYTSDFTPPTIAFLNTAPIANVLPGGFAAATTYYDVSSGQINPLSFSLAAKIGSAGVVGTSVGLGVIANDLRYYFTSATGISLLLHMNNIGTPNTFLDSSANNLAITRFIGTQQATTVKYGAAAGAFPSIDLNNPDKLTTPVAAGGVLDLHTGKFTIEGWFYVSALGGNDTTGHTYVRQYIYDHNNTRLNTSNPNPTGTAAYVDSVGNLTGTWQINAGTSGSWTHQTVVTVGVWHHFAVVNSDSGLDIYLDGIKNTVGAAPPIPFSVPDGLGFFCVGNEGQYHSIRGFYDDFRVLKGTAQYTANFTPPAAQFVDPDAANGSITFVGSGGSGSPLALFGTMRLGWQVTVPTVSATLSLQYNIGAGNVVVPITNTAGASGVISICLEGATQLTISVVSPAIGAVVAVGEATGDSTYGNVNFNCSCPEPDTFDTMVNLRNRLMLRLGFGAQQANPPPGMTPLLNEFLQSAQVSLYKRYPARFTRRFFTWAMQAGDRFYGVKANTDDVYRNLRADFTKGIEWSGIQDPKNTWTPIFEGIMPELYTMATQFGRPVRYEIRECIEVFPAPDGPYTLVLKAHTALQPFIADSDQTTIDSEVVFLHALAVAKMHYGQPDANNTQAIANAYLGELCAGTHLNRRYIPGAHPQMPIVKPALIKFQDGS